MLWLLPALIGGAIRIGGNIVGRARRAAAAEEAIEIGQRNLLEGQNAAAMNANQTIQDNNYILSLSGVRSDVGTAKMIEDMTHNAKAATLNRMGRDFNEWSNNVREADKTDAINTAFNITGGVFSTIGQLYYDNERYIAGQQQQGGLVPKNYQDNLNYSKSSYNIEDN